MGALMMEKSVISCPVISYLRFSLFDSMLQMTVKDDGLVAHR